MALRPLVIIAVTAVLASGCSDQDGADAGASVCTVVLTEHGSQATATCYSPGLDGGQLHPTEVISGGSSPVSEASLGAQGVIEQNEFFEGVYLQAAGHLPDLMDETNSLGNVTVRHEREFGNCILHGTCEGASVVLETDAGLQLIPGASYVVRITGRQPLSCALVGSGDVCNALHGSIHAVLMPGSVVVDWSF